MQKAFNTLTLADQVENKIIEYIKENDLHPGDSLPNEMTFMEMFGISRNVVREAMSRLRMLGLIQTRTKRGITITEPPLLNGLRKVVAPQFLSTATIKEMMGLRITLEIGLAEFLFDKITEESILELREIVTRQTLLGINNLSIEDEVQFHTKIYEIANNQLILQLNEIMHPIFEFAKHNYENYFKPISEKLKNEDSLVTHQTLLELIEKKDKEGYQQAMRQHLQPYREFIENF